MARAAGVDKVLIHRYFGGLPELMAAFGREGGFRPSVVEMTGGDTVAFAAAGIDEKLKIMARRFLTAIRSRPLTQEILAWEMVEHNELTGVLEAIRENTMEEIFERFFPETRTGHPGPVGNGRCSDQLCGSLSGPGQPAASPVVVCALPRIIGFFHHDREDVDLRLWICHTPRVGIGNTGVRTR